MTTYILCGGNLRGGGDKFGTDFADAIDKLIETREPRILDCCFAWPEDQWQEQSLLWQDFYMKYLPDASSELARRENFLQQVGDSDIIFFHGGRTQTLFDNIANFNLADLTDTWAGKIVVGNSSGANLLSQHFLSRSGIKRGSGVLPFNICCHYESDDPEQRRTQKAVNEMVQKHPEVPTLILREGELAIFQETK